MLQRHRQPLGHIEPKMKLKLERLRTWWRLHQKVKKGWSRFGRPEYHFRTRCFSNTDNHKDTSSYKKRWNSNACRLDDDFIKRSKNEWSHFGRPGISEIGAPTTLPTSRTKKALLRLKLSCLRTWWWLHNEGSHSERPFPLGFSAPVTLQPIARGEPS